MVMWGRRRSCSTEGECAGVEGRQRPGPAALSLLQQAQAASRGPGRLGLHRGLTAHPCTASGSWPPSTFKTSSCSLLYLSNIPPSVSEGDPQEPLLKQRRGHGLNIFPVIVVLAPCSLSHPWYLDPLTHHLQKKDHKMVWSRWICWRGQCRHQPSCAPTT